MFKRDFVEQFVIHWLATWSANNYEDCCLKDNHDKLESPPLEDAIYLAEKTWEEILENTDECRKYF